MNNCFLEEIQQTVKDIKNEEYDLCFAVLSDTCLFDAGADTRENIGAVDKEIGFDFLVHLGNVINGDNPRDISCRLLRTELEKYKSSVKSGRLFVTQGGRDGYRDERFTGQLATNIMYDELWCSQTDFTDEYSGVVRPGRKPYYYADMPDKKIRLIFLCSYYSQFDQENELYEKYTRIDVAQAAWLKNEALSAPEGTTVILFSHALPKSRFEEGKDPFVYNGFSTEPILMILQQAQRRGINIAGWLAGAYNCDAEIKVAGINHVLISSEAIRRGTSSKHPEVRFLENRVMGEKTEDCWDAVTLNLKKRELAFHRFGAGDDRRVQY